MVGGTAPGRMTLVLENAGEPQGFINSRSTSPECSVTKVSVAPFVGPVTIPCWLMSPCSMRYGIHEGASDWTSNVKDTIALPLVSVLRAEARLVTTAGAFELIVSDNGRITPSPV